MGLIDLNGKIGRIDGGVGLSICEPGIEVVTEISDGLSVEGPMSDVAKEYGRTVIDHFEAEPCYIKIKSGISRHIGLGSGTQLALAIGKAITEENGINISTRKLSNIVGRGGTSGIGTAAFEHGGFILDGGHSKQEKEKFLPSSASDAPPPPIISRMEFPNWNIKVFVPEGNRTHGHEEKSLFLEEAPISINEVRKVSHIILMKLLPAIKESKFKQFRQAINSLQSEGWKRKEIQKQPRSKEIIDELSKDGVAAGLSSWGPAVFAISPNELDSMEFGCESFCTEPNSDGANIMP